MEIRFKVVVNKKVMGLEEAIEKGFVKVKQEGLEAMDNALLNLSTNIYDKEDNEIYINDELFDDDGKRYVVKNIFGTAYLYNFSNGNYSLVSSLSSLQFKNKIDLINRSKWG